MNIHVIDDLPPETVAMLQALYSRSPKSVTEHLEKVEKGPEKFMERYYVGYNHKSIGDCGTTTLFIEDVSMLAAKAIQDNPLYNGQEASTRYLDMANRTCVNNKGGDAGAKIQARWIEIYTKVLDALIPHFEERFPQGDAKEKVWKKAVKARAFDVARGFLPAGCTTFVAWHTNLRQAADHLKLMRYNPCQEIREIAEHVNLCLSEVYPSSFGHKRYAEQDAYLDASAETFAYSETKLDHYDYNSHVAGVPYFSHDVRLDLVNLSRYRGLLGSRPAKTELHQRFRQFGDIVFTFPLDFGGYRDLQRHRSCVQEMPLLTTNYGMLPWYLEQLPGDLKSEVIKDISDQEALIHVSTSTNMRSNITVAMGYVCPIKITCSLPSATYIAELRSGSTVHPTVRKIAQQMGETLRRFLPDMALHVDNSEGVWDIKRGTQDIVEK